MIIKSIFAFFLLVFIVSQIYGVDTQEQYDYAAELFKHRQYSNARREFETLLDSFNQIEDPLESELAPQALFHIGDASFRLLDYEAGVKAYLELSDKYPDTDLARRALLRVAKYHEDDGRYQDALDEYAQLIDRYPDNEEAALAAEVIPRIGGLFLDNSIKLLTRPNPEDGVAQLEWLAARFPRTDFARRALSELGGYRESLGDFEGALKDYARLAELYPESEEAKRAKDKVAMIQKELGQGQPEKPLSAMSEAPESKTEKMVEAKGSKTKKLLGGRRTFLSLGNKLLGLKTKMSLQIVSPTAELRDGAGVEHPVIAKVSKGDAITLVELSGKWYKVKIENGVEGWIWGGAVSGSKFRVVLSLVNVRRAAGTVHDVITRVQKDTVLTKLDEVEGWYRVRLPDGGEGWIWGETLVLSSAN